MSVLQLLKERVLESPPDEENEETTVYKEKRDGLQREDSPSVRSPRGESILDVCKNQKTFTLAISSGLTDSPKFSCRTEHCGCHSNK